MVMDMVRLFDLLRAPQVVAGIIAAVVGVVVTVVTNKVQLGSSRAGRRAEHIRQQINLLYGPLTALLERAVASAQLVANITRSGDEHSKRLGGGADAGAIIEVSNQYWDVMADTFPEADSLVREHRGLLDAEDAGDVLAWIQMGLRHEVEFKKRHKLPPEMYDKTLQNPLSVPIFEHSTLDVIRGRLHQKQNELQALQGEKARSKGWKRRTGGS